MTTPFKMCFGIEAVVPQEIIIPSPRISVDPIDFGYHKFQLDTIEEERNEAKKRILQLKRKSRSAHEKKVKPRSFQKNDLVLRSSSVAGHHPTKLGPKWEGPFQIEEVLGNGAYVLKTVDHKKLSRPWNVDNLKKKIPVKTNI